MESDSISGGNLPNDYVCEFMSSDHLTSVSFTLSCNVGGLKNGPDLYSAVVPGFGGGTFTPVTLAKADAAFWIPASTDGGFRGSILMVFFGGSSSFGLTFLLPSTTSVDAAAAEQMAAVVLGKL